MGRLPSKVSHTGAHGWHRLVTQAEFAGEVRPGAHYLRDTVLSAALKSKADTYAVSLRLTESEDSWLWLQKKHVTEVYLQLKSERTAPGATTASQLENS